MSGHKAQQRIDNIKTNPLEHSVAKSIRARSNKTFFMLNSAEHELFSANENASNNLHFHIYKQRNFHAQLCLARKNFQLLVIL